MLHGSDDIGKAFFVSAEAVDADKQQDQGDDHAAQDGVRAQGLLTREEAPAEAFDDPGHGVEDIEPAPLVGNDIAVVGHGGDIDAGLQQEGHEVAEVAEPDEQGGGEQSQASRQGETKDDEEGQEQGPPVGQELVPGIDPCQHDEGYDEIDKAGHVGREGDDDPWEIDFGDEPGVGEYRVAGFCDGVGEEGPGQQADVDHEAVGHVHSGGYFAPAVEYEGEDEHGEQGADDAPERAYFGLFIAHPDISPAEDIEQFAVAPYVAPVLFFLQSGFYDRFSAHISERAKNSE